MNEIGGEYYGISADPALTGGLSPDRNRLDELLSSMTDQLTDRERVYYLEVEVVDSIAQRGQTVRVLEELANATDLRGSIPESDEVSSSDTEIALLVVSTISPSNIVDAIEEQACIQTVSLWEVDTDRLDVPVVERPRQMKSHSDEFDHLRAVYEGGDQTGEFDGLEPESVQFAEDELTYEEVLDDEQFDDTGSEADDRSIDWGSNDEPVIAKLAAELERSNRTDEHVTTICRHLVENQSRTSVDVRLRHVQSQLSSLNAYAEALEARARRRPLRGRVTIQGFVPELQRFYAAADVFVHTALLDPHPRAVLEAMAASLPVVAFATDGVGETVTHGETGTLVPKEDAARLAEALARYLEDPEAAKRMGGAGRDRVERSFSPRDTARKVDAIVHDALIRMGRHSKRKGVVAEAAAS